MVASPRHPRLLPVLLGTALAAAWPREAATSGSSEISAASTHAVLRVESVRMIFADPDEERRWHVAWRALNEQAAAVVVAQIEARLLADRGDLALIPHRPDLPLAGEGSPTDPCAGAPCRYQLYPRAPDLPSALPLDGMVSVEVALGTRPGPEALARLAGVVGRALVVEQAPPDGHPAPGG